jgi:hypothetical protein
LLWLQFSRAAGTNVRTSHIVFSAALFVCGGYSEALSDNASMREAYKIVKKIDTLWAYTAFVYLCGATFHPQQTPLQPGAQPLPLDPRVTMPNYRDGYFILRHPQLKRW